MLTLESSELHVLFWKFLCTKWGIIADYGYIFLRKEGNFISRYNPSCEGHFHTPSITFQHLPPNSARFSYTTEGALFVSTQLSTDAVSAL